VLGVAAIGSGIERADSVGWSDVNIALLAAGLVVLAAFPLRSRRAAHPLIDLSVFSNPRFVLLLFLSSVGAACYAATLFAVSVYLQDARGLTTVRASLAFAIMAVLQALAAPVGARLQPRTGPLLVLAGAGLISGASLVALTAITSWWAYVPVLALCGFGLGLEYAVATIASQQVVGPDRAGEVSGIVLTIRTTAAGISLAAAASIVEAVEHAGHGTGAACHVTLLIVGLLSLAAALIAASARYVFVRHGLI
jgi:MFS family permease